MSVYKEGYFIVESLQKQSKQIYPDACDFGVRLKKGDANWNQVKQLVEWYGVKETRNQENYSTGKFVECDVELLDEWAVSDKRKTEKEALDKFHVSYVTCKVKGVDGDGYITIN